jgi:hypothetical protein
MDANDVYKDQNVFNIEEVFSGIVAMSILFGTLPCSLLP